MESDRGEAEREVSYSISEMAEIHGISRQTLLYYDRIGLFSPAWTEPRNGYRRYTLEQCPLLREIRLLAGLGVPLAEIRDYLEKKTLDQIRELLEEQREATRRRREELERTETILDIRLANIAKAFEADERDSLRVERRGRRLYTSLSYPAEGASGEASSLLFRGMIGRFRRILRGERFSRYYHELRFKHGQLYVDSEGRQGAVIFADEEVFREIEGVLEEGEAREIRSSLSSWEPADYAQGYYRGSLEGAPGEAERFLDRLRGRGLKPSGGVLFSALLEPPFILDPEDQLYWVEAPVEEADT